VSGKLSFKNGTGGITLVSGLEERKSGGHFNTVGAVRELMKL
jgi:hypothetical protein